MDKNEKCKHQILIISILILFVMLIYQLNFGKNFNINRKNYTIYVETGEGTGKYVIQTSSIFPTQNYYLNKEKTNSECVNAYVKQNKNKSINFSATFSTHCNLYFDYGETPNYALETLNMLNLLNQSIVVNGETPDFNYNSEGENGEYIEVVVSESTESSSEKKEKQYIVDETKITNGIYESEDDYGASYYWRGAVQNYNYVKFANMLWSIVRINGDGSLRLIYVTNYNENNEIDEDNMGGITSESKNVYYNDKYTDNGYLGYMYGNFSEPICENSFGGNCQLETGSSSYAEAHANINSSGIKTLVDNWYKDNLINYQDYISDTLFCNDRSIAKPSEVTYSNNEFDITNFTQDGYSVYNTIYSSAARIKLNDNISPSLFCKNQNDRFTVSDTTNGNGDLTYPIGLMTADEYVFNGASLSAPNNSFFHNVGKYNYTMTPFANAKDSGNYYMMALEGNVDAVPALIAALGVVSFNRFIQPVINLTQDAVSLFEGTGSIEDPFRINEATKSNKTLELLHEKNSSITVNEGTPDFNYTFAGEPIDSNGNEVTVDDTKVSNGIYSAKDDYGTSFYWRGNVNNNYIKFANKYWRIVRINGDGSLRVMYDGTSPGAGESIGTSVYNNNANDNGYVGYMYGNFETPSNCNQIDKTVTYDGSSIEVKAFQCESGGSTSYENAHSNQINSAIKNYLDNWYDNNLSSYDESISDTLFCNNRAIQLITHHTDDYVTQVYSQLNTQINSGFGYKTGFTAYDIYISIENNLPSLECQQKEDSFTKEDTVIGNGNLSKKIGLLNFDEMFASGITYDETINNNTFLKRNYKYWSMTPVAFDTGQITNNTTSPGALVIYIDKYKEPEVLLNVSDNSDIHVVPVINIKYSALSDMTGTGTEADPFIIE